MNHNRYLRFASSSPCTSLCLAMTPVVWKFVCFRWCETMWNRGRGAAGSCLSSGEKKKLLQNKLWKREQYQIKTRLCFQIISRGCTCFWPPWCSHVFLFFGCSQRIIMNPSPLAIEALGKMPTVHLPAHHSEQDFFEPSLTQKPFRPVFHSKLAFGLGLFQPKTLLSSLFSWFPANVRIKFHAFPLSGTDSRLKVATHTFLATP